MLKIAADHSPDVRIVATGSSTLGASARFRDTLAGRKADLWLTPMVSADLEDFGRKGLRHRFLLGGLPPFFLAADPPEEAFQEWMDTCWAKDVQGLFRLERRHSFLRLVELLLARSGGIFEATAYAGPCEISRATVTNYLAVLEATHLVSVVRPFNTHRPTEIVAAPRVYGFDTGFVCTHRGWHTLRSEDLGPLWEHYVLNELQARLPSRSVRYWRDKSGHEVDFVVERRGGTPVAIECKWSASHFDPAGIQAFRRAYPDGPNLVVASDVDRSHAHEVRGVRVRYVSLEGLVSLLSRRSAGEPPLGSSAG
jgi:hypothetical protein